MIQVAIIYLTSTVTKNGEFWQAGVVLESTTTDMTHAGLLAGWLADKPGLCRFLTHATLCVEGSIAVLVFFPWKNTITRVIACIGLLGVHISLGFSMDVGPFYLISSGFAFVLLPPAVWDKLRVPKAFNFRKTIADKKSLLPASAAKPLRIVSSAVLIFMLCFIFQKNLAKWQEASYWSDSIKGNKALSGLASMKLPRVGGVSGLFNQSWWLFAPDPYKDMGTLLFVGSKGDGVFYDIYTEEEVFFRLAGQQQTTISGTPHVQFSGSLFVHSFYLRRYLQRLEQEPLRQYRDEVYQRYFDHVYAEWLEKHGDPGWLGVALVYIRNKTSLKKGKLVHQQEVFPLYTKQ